MKLKALLKQIVNGILPALPFGNVLTEIKNNLNDDGYTPTGAINWPKLLMYFITGLIVIARLLGLITNDDVMQLIETLSGLNA